MEPAGAPVTMSSEGSGVGGFLMWNQLQPDRQANTMRSDAFN